MHDSTSVADLPLQGSWDELTSTLVPQPWRHKNRVGILNVSSQRPRTYAYAHAACHLEHFHIYNPTSAEPGLLPMT